MEGISLERYDTTNEKYKKFLKRVKSYKIRKNAQNSNEYFGEYIVFYDKNGKDIHTSRVEILGQYFIEPRIWAWGWSLNLPGYLMQNIKKVLLYGIDIDEVASFNKMFNKILLVNSRLHITNVTLIDISCAIASLITKIPFIFAIDAQQYWKPQEYNEVLIDFDGCSSILYLFILDPPSI